MDQTFSPEQKEKHAGIIQFSGRITTFIIYMVHKRINSSFILINFFIFIIGTTILDSCQNNLSSSSDFMVTVDSISVPDTVMSGTAFNIEFFGTIGMDKCVSFKTFNRIDQGNNITIETWATYNDMGGQCPPALVTLSGHIVNMTISVPGNYLIIIKEPYSYSIIKKLTVN